MVPNKWQQREYVNIEDLKSNCNVKVTVYFDDVPGQSELDDATIVFLKAVSEEVKE